MRARVPGRGGVRERPGECGLGSVGLLDCHQMTSDPPSLNRDPFKGKNCAVSFLLTCTHTHVRT